MTDATMINIPAAEYHRHKSLSSSGARKLLPPSCPALFRWEQDHPPESIPYDFGRAAHKLVLGDLDGEVAVIDADDRRTKAYKQADAEARARGATPILRKQWDEIVAMAEKIRGHKLAMRLLDPDSGQPEQSIFWTDTDTGVERRARIDWLRYQRRGRLLIVDYKTAVSAAKADFARAASNFGYHQQVAWYRDAVRAAGLDDDPGFVFVVQEKTPPYLVNVIELGAASVDVGAGLNREALNVYAECVAADRWPSYSEDIEIVDLPAWYLNEHEGIAA